MLDAWIIEEIRRREEAQRQNERRPAVLEVPLHEPPRPPNGNEQGRSDEQDTPRGVVIIDFSVS